MSPLIGFQVISATYFQATGKPRQATVSDALPAGISLIPLLWILPKYFANGLDGVWMAWPFADAAASSLLTGICLYWELRHLDSRHQETTAEKLRRGSAGRGESGGAGRRDVADRGAVE